MAKVLFFFSVMICTINPGVLSRYKFSSVDNSECINPRLSFGSLLTCMKKNKRTKRMPFPCIYGQRHLLMHLAFLSFRSSRNR